MIGMLKQKRSLSIWEQRGFFPRRGENGDAFRQRVRTTLATHHKPSDGTTSTLQSKLDPMIHSARSEFINRWGCFPDWIKIYDRTPRFFPLILAQHVELYEKKDPHAQHSTMQANDKHKSQSAVPAFVLKDQWIEMPLSCHSYISFLYSMKELLHHEWIHAVRFSEEEDYFEESIAYLSSKSTFRQLLGPVISDPFLLRILGFQIAAVFMILCAAQSQVLHDQIYSDSSFALIVKNLLLFLSAGLLSYLGKLLYKGAMFRRFTHRLKRYSLLPLLLRLDPQDIASLGKLKPARWPDFFNKVPGLYGISLRRVFNCQADKFRHL